MGRHEFLDYDDDPLSTRYYCGLLDGLAIACIIVMITMWTWR